jgi:CheY-like chemotaxis protein
VYPPDDRRVLVVEDNFDAAELLRQLLVTCGYAVTVAHSAQEGLESARRLEPHVVLCDIGLPDSDGYVVGSILRQNAHANQVRLIAMTGRNQPDDRSRSLAAGFDQHLVKPLDTKELLLELESR